MLKITAWFIHGAINWIHQLGETAHSNKLKAYTIEKTLPPTEKQFALKGYYTFRNNKNRRLGEIANLAENIL